MSTNEYIATLLMRVMGLEKLLERIVNAISDDERTDSPNLNQLCRKAEAYLEGNGTL